MPNCAPGAIPLTDGFCVLPGGFDNSERFFFGDDPGNVCTGVPFYNGISEPLGTGTINVGIPYDNSIDSLPAWTIINSVKIGIAGLETPAFSNTIELKYSAISYGTLNLGSAGNLTHTFTLNPDTGLPWTLAEVKAAFSVQLVVTVVTSVDLYALWVQIDYTVPPTLTAITPTGQSSGAEATPVVLTGTRFWVGGDAPLVYLFDGSDFFQMFADTDYNPAIVISDTETDAITPFSPETIPHDGVYDVYMYPYGSFELILPASFTVGGAASSLEMDETEAVGALLVGNVGATDDDTFVFNGVRMDSDVAVAALKVGGQTEFEFFSPSTPTVQNGGSWRLHSFIFKYRQEEVS